MSNNLNILIVDDDKSNLLILSSHLRKQGYTVFTSEHVIQAFEIIKYNVIDVVLTDIEMPYVNGIDFIIWLSKYKPEIQTIVMTGYGFDELKEFSDETGVLKYFEKPIDINKIIALIKEGSEKKGISAKMSKVKIFDFIQLIIFSGKDKVISVYDSKTETSGNIYIKNRKIIDAEINGKKGADSFYEIVKIKDGYFSEYDLTENRDITINKATTVLMIKSAEILQQMALEDKEYKKEMNVVIIEENPIDTMILQKYLMDRDFNVITTMFAKDGLEIMRKKKSDYLAIIDINLHGTDSFELMKTIKKEHLAKEVILVSTFSDDVVKNRAYNEGAIAFFNKPIDIKELEGIIAINFGNQGGLSGIAKGITISDFLQLEIASKTNKIINIFDNYTSKEGKLYISEGKVLHAEIDDLSGVQAFNKILQLKNGSFIQKEWEEPKVITIDKNIQNLLMDSVKILDENNSELINLSPELLNRLFLMAYSERENFVLTNIIKPKTYISESYKKIEKISFVDIIDPFDFDGLLSLTILDIAELETVAVKTKSFISEDDLVKMDLNIIKSIAERFHEGKIKEIVISLDIMTQIIIPIKDSKECFCVVIFDNNQIKEPLDKIKEIIVNFTKNVKFLK